MRRTALTGIKPTGRPHLGNYLGMIRPALELAGTHDAYYFVADVHALNQLRDARELERLTRETAATWLALGLDPAKTVFFRQSDVPEVFELCVVLAASTAKGLLNRAHAYKAAVDANLAAGRDPDAGVNMGLFTYPVLMAADILLFGANDVPVGEDQRQHVEIAADIAEAFNRTYGKVLTIPEAVTPRDTASITGTDGRKMSKSYDNVIPIFAPPAELRKRVMGIRTDSRPPESPKEPETDPIFGLYRHFAAPAERDAMRAQYLAGGIGYAEAKERLLETIERTFSEPRRRFDEYMKDPAHLKRNLQEGAVRARAKGAVMLRAVRKAAGIGE